MMVISLNYLNSEHRKCLIVQLAQMVRAIGVAYGWPVQIRYCMPKFKGLRLKDLSTQVSKLSKSERFKFARLISICKYRECPEKSLDSFLSFGNFLGFLSGRDID